MSTSVLQLLQQEKARLEKENRLQQAEILTLRQYVEVMAELYWATQQIPFLDNPLDTLDQLLYNVIKVIGASDGSLSRLDETTGELEFLLVQGEVRHRLPGHRISSDVGVAGWVVGEGEPLIVNNPRQDWRFSLQVDEQFTFLTRSILGVPIMSHNKPIGVIQILNKQHGDFTQTDALLVSVLSHAAALVFAKMAVQSQAGVG